MKSSVVWALIAVASLVATAEAGNIHAKYYSNRHPWHGAYYDPAWGGSPAALVVPPTAERQFKYSWGVTNTELKKIPHQFDRRFPGFNTGGYGFAPTPPIPGHTDQFGYYYVRGPWR